MKRFSIRSLFQGWDNSTQVPSAAMSISRQRPVSLQPFLFCETPVQIYLMTCYAAVREDVVFVGPGSFEKWNNEDYEHATDYETWNHRYDSEATQKRTGKWYWKDLDPDLKNENSQDLKDRGIISKYRLGALDLREKANSSGKRAIHFLGLAILNHVVSAVEARIATKRFNNRLQNTLMQTQARAFDIGVQVDRFTGALTGTLVLRKIF